MRNKLEDWTRFLLALLIVFAHIVPLYVVPGFKGLLYYLYGNGIARATLPLFFAFAGYRIPADFTFAVLKKRVARILKLFAVWQAIYCFFPIREFIADGSIVNLLTSLFHGYWHLWYLAAVISSLSLLYFLSKRFSRIGILSIGLVLYAIGYALMLAMNLGAFDGTEWLKAAYQLMGTSRNGVFYGLLFVALGWSMPEWEKRARPGVLRAAAICSVPLLLAESLAYRYSLRQNMDLYVFTLPIVAGVLYWVEKDPRTEMRSVDPNLAIGIYLLHAMALKLLFILRLDRGIVFNFAVVLAATLVLFALCSRADKRLKLLF